MLLKSLLTFWQVCLASVFWQKILNHVLDHLSKSVSKTKLKIQATFQEVFWNLFLTCLMKVVENLF